MELHCPWWLALLESALVCPKAGSQFVRYWVPGVLELSSSSYSVIFEDQFQVCKIREQALQLQKYCACPGLLERI